MILVTHNLDHADKVADKKVYMKNGQIVNNIKF